MGVPTLSPEQAAMMQKGLSELVQMRHKGLKAQKHRTSVVPLPISLEKLNSGCIRTVSRYVKKFRRQSQSCVPVVMAVSSLSVLLRTDASCYVL